MQKKIVQLQYIGVKSTGMLIRTKTSKESYEYKHETVTGTVQATGMKIDRFWKCAAVVASLLLCNTSES